MSDTEKEEKKKRIGDLLVEAGVITEDQMWQALEEQRKHGGRFCYNLIRLGSLKADDLLLFLRDQFGVAAVNLDHFRIDKTVLEKVPAAFAREKKLIPLHILGSILTVAMVDPGKKEDIVELEKITGCTIEPMICPEASLEATFKKYYDVTSHDDISIKEGILKIGGEKEEAHLYRMPPPAGGFSPLDWLKIFFLQAIKRRCREIHLEPTAQGIQVRYRVGKRLEKGEKAPVEIQHEIVKAAFTLARMDLQGSGTRPMEGRIKLFIGRRLLRTSVSSFPTLNGDRLVLTIMDEAVVGRDFQELGMSKEIADEVTKILGFDRGIFLVVAPPKQGKKATFYSIMSHLSSRGGLNVMSLEHPIYYPMPNVSQTQVSFGSGLDFYFGLQSILHQKPDVVGLTDLNDRKTMELVFTAARQCLVVGLCNFWDSIQTLEWIRSCGISPRAQGLHIHGILVQRVLSRICSKCREPLDDKVTLVEGVRDKRNEDLSFYFGRGCENCGSSGKIGRLGLFELLSFRLGLREMLARGEEVQIIYEEAQRLGMWTLQEEGIMKATQGLVDIREVLEMTRKEESEE